MNRLRLIDRLIECRQRERLPEQLAQPRCLAILFEPCTNGQAKVIAVSGLAADERAHAKHREPLAPIERFPRQHAGKKIQRRR